MFYLKADHHLTRVSLPLGPGLIWVSSGEVCQLSPSLTHVPGHWFGEEGRWWCWWRYGGGGVEPLEADGMGGGQWRWGREGVQSHDWKKRVSYSKASTQLAWKHDLMLWGCHVEEKAHHDSQLVLQPVGWQQVGDRGERWAFLWERGKKGRLN